MIGNFGDCLAEKGISFEVCFEQILGIKNVDDAEITKDQLKHCFQLMGFDGAHNKIDEFLKIVCQQGEDVIMVSELMEENKKLQSGTADADKLNTLGKQMRRFYKNEDIEEHLGALIVECKMLDFGHLLKGQDFQDDNTISRGDFYQTIMSIPQFTEGNGLKAGDVMDLMNKYDYDHTGYIRLNDIKASLDQVITPLDSVYRITLKSTVKEACEEAIVEVEHKKKNYRGAIKAKVIERPKILQEAVLDIFCGLYVKSRDFHYLGGGSRVRLRVLEHFEDFCGANRQLSQHEFS